jgi:invasion protein IalB
LPFLFDFLQKAKSGHNLKIDASRFGLRQASVGFGLTGFGEV